MGLFFNGEGKCDWCGALLYVDHTFDGVCKVCKARSWEKRLREARRGPFWVESGAVPRRDQWMRQPAGFRREPRGSGGCF